MSKRLLNAIAISILIFFEVGTSCRVFGMMDDYSEWKSEYEKSQIKYNYDDDAPSGLMDDYSEWKSVYDQSKIPEGGHFQKTQEQKKDTSDIKKDTNDLKEAKDKE